MTNWVIGKCASCGADARRGAEACTTCGARFTVDKPSGAAGALFVLSWLIGLGVFFGMRGGETLGAVICVSGVAWLAALRVQAPIKGMIVKGLVLAAALSLSACASSGPAGDPSGAAGNGGLVQGGDGGPGPPTVPCGKVPSTMIGGTLCGSDPVCVGDTCSVAAAGCSYLPTGAMQRRPIGDCTYQGTYPFDFDGRPAGFAVTILCYGPGSVGPDLTACPAP